MKTECGQAGNRGIEPQGGKAKKIPLLCCVRVLFVFVLLSGVVLCVEASESLAALYNRGNEHYRRGDYEQAIAVYERVISQGLNNGEVYYNLGNAYYKAGNLGRAILSYERALKLMPGDDDVVANLAFANAHKVDREPEEEVNVLTRFLRAIFGFFGVNALTILLGVCLFGLGGGAVGWLFVPMRRLLWAGLLIIFGLGLVGSGGMLAFKVHQRNIPRAVIIDTEVSGRSGPGSDFLQVFTLHEGTVVTIERAEGLWLLVRLRSGLGGWVETTVLERI